MNKDDDTFQALQYWYNRAKNLEKENKELRDKING